jgi:prephenate dehydrogenase
VRIAVVGTGLIGASAALAARRAGLGDVCGWDEDPQALDVAVERGAVEPAPSLPDALRGADVALAAVPVAALPAVVREVLSAAPETCAVTDVGSTKAAVCAAAGDDPRFVGGHPICALGARPVAIDPAAHDRLVAVTSHLPHALANLLLNQAGAARVEGHEALATAGGSLRDMTRIAGANPRIWVDIFLENRDALRSALSEHRRRVEQLEAALDEGDAGFLARWIGEAGGNRRRMLETAYEDPGSLHRVRAHVPDRPGVLAGIFQALGAERINVADFELEHLSPDRGGTLTILVAGEASAALAADLLGAQGYGAVVAPVLEG